MRAAARIRWYGRAGEGQETQVQELYYEDLEPGRVFRGRGRRQVDRDEIKAFAREFDPQPFHLDEAAAEQSLFGGLAASGWHTAAITMQLLVTSEFRIAGGLVGLGVEKLRWPRPTRPGDELRVEVEVLTARESRSRPGYGLVTTKTTTFNQEGAAVQEAVNTMIVPRRETSP